MQKEIVALEKTHTLQLPPLCWSRDTTCIPSSCKLRDIYLLVAPSFLSTVTLVFFPVVLQVSSFCFFIGDHKFSLLVWIRSFTNAVKSLDPVTLVTQIIFDFLRRYYFRHQAKQVSTILTEGISEGSYCVWQLVDVFLLSGYHSSCKIMVLSSNLMSYTCHVFGLIC